MWGLMRSEYCQIIPGEIARKFIDLAQDNFGWQSEPYLKASSSRQMRQKKMRKSLETELSTAQNPAQGQKI